MIQEFVDKWNINKLKVREKFKMAHPESYKSIVESVIEMLADDEEETMPDFKKIHMIDDGDYQGTLLFVIPENGDYPSKYWSVFVDYGSCSECDTLQRICGFSDELPTDSQVDEYMTLALHIIQGLKVIGEES